MSHTTIVQPLHLARLLTGQLHLPLSLLDDLLQLHSRQWQLEDRSREPHATDQILAALKRDIDLSNTTRHTMINALDAACRITIATPTPTPRFYAETIGELCDRLLILHLKLHAAAEPGPIHQICAHLTMHTHQLIHDIEVGAALLPPRVGLKIYNGTVAEGTDR